MLWPSDMLPAGRRPQAGENCRHWWILGQGFWTWAQTSITRMTTMTSQIPPKPFPYEVSHCGVWRFESDYTSLCSPWNNSVSRLLQKLPPETVTLCREGEPPDLLKNAIIFHDNTYLTQRQLLQSHIQHRMQSNNWNTETGQCAISNEAPSILPGSVSMWFLNHLCMS